MYLTGYVLFIYVLYLVLMYGFYVGDMWVKQAGAELGNTKFVNYLL